MLAGRGCWLVLADASRPANFALRRKIATGGVGAGLEPPQLKIWPPRESQHKTVEMNIRGRCLV